MYRFHHLEYNSDANTDDGSCLNLSVYGCTNPMAINFNSQANGDDNSCEFELSLKGIKDLDLSKRALHLVANTDIDDLSDFGFGIANNGGGTDGQEYIFDAISVSSGDDILVTSSSMESYFLDCMSEFEHIINIPFYGDGDDAVELYHDNVLIETFGDPDVDGSYQNWDYTDSWAYKLDGQWTYGGRNCSDNSGTLTTQLRTVHIQYVV